MRSPLLRVPLLILMLLTAGCLSASVPADPDSDRALLTAPFVCPEPCELAVDAGPGRAFEPHVAVNPADPLHIVVVDNTFVYVDKTPVDRWITVHVSRDGGESWKMARLPGGPGSSPTHPLARATGMADPLVAFLPDGTVLVAGLAGTDLSFAAGSGATLFVARSTDGGLTFPEVRIVMEGSGLFVATGGVAVVHNDKPAMTVAHDGTVLLAWTRNEFTYAWPTPVGMGKSEFPFAVSRDGGKSWERVGTINTGGTIGAYPLLARDGTLHAVHLLWGKDEKTFKDFELHHLSSGDGGATWEARNTWTGVYFGAYPTLAARPTAEGEELLLTFAIPRSSGLYGRQEPVLVTSRDGGETWSEPLVLDAAEADGITMPTLTVDGKGRIHAGVYHPLEDGTVSEYRVVTVDNGTVVSSVTVSRSPIGRHNMGITGLGHYMGIAPLPEGALAVWVSGEGTATDLRAARILPG